MFADSTPRTGTGLVAYGGTLGQMPDPSEYSLVISDTSMAPELARLPGLTLAYFSGSGVNTDWNAGVPYSQAAANGWLLTDSSGNQLVNQGYPEARVGNVGDPAYQQAWLSNVLSFLSAHPGVKGVFIDDVLYDLAPLAGQEATLYPTQSAWAQAQLSFIKTVGTALRARGYYVLANASGYIPNSPELESVNEVTWWRELGPYVNGLMDEYYQELSDGSNVLRTTGTAWNQDWTGWQHLVYAAQSMGDDFYGLTYGDPGDTAVMTYGKASFLLDWNGHGGAFIYATTNGSDPANPAWMTSIGLPFHHKQQVGVGWLRQYTDGVTVVDPNAESAQTFQLPGRYRTADGAVVSSITLRPTSAAILEAIPANSGRDKLRAGTRLEHGQRR